MFIYLIVNHATGKYYVGQHKGNNLQHYLQQKFSEAAHRLKARSYLYNSMRKHGREAFTIHALLSDVQTRTELDQYERDFIAFLRSQNSEYGYNICRGGEGFSGPHSEESKRKTSVSNKRRFELNPELREKVGQETKERMKDPQYLAKATVNLGLAHTPEVASKISITKQLKGQTEEQKASWRKMLATQHHSGLPAGFRHSEESKAKMRVSMKGRRASNLKNMAGQVINGIAVLERVVTKISKAAWLCRCICGGIFTASGDNLRTGHTKSCGCLSRNHGNRIHRIQSRNSEVCLRLVRGDVSPAHRPQRACHRPHRGSD